MAAAARNGLARVGIIDTAQAIGGGEEWQTGERAHVVEVRIAQAHDGTIARQRISVDAVLLLCHTEHPQIACRRRRTTNDLMRVGTILRHGIEGGTSRACAIGGDRTVGACIVQ